MADGSLDAAAFRQYLVFGGGTLLGPGALGD
jgi:hypothetical protein